MATLRTKLAALRRRLPSWLTDPSWFVPFSRAAEAAIGSPFALFIVLIAILVWLASGPFFGWNNTWQLIANTVTTLVTTVVVIVIQGATHRENEAIQVQLAELLRAVQGARTELGIATELDSKRLREVHEELRQEAQQAAGEQESGTS